MRTLQVHFSNKQQPDQPLRRGVQRVVRHASGAIVLGDDSMGPLLLAQLCLDSRGLWLQVVSGTRSVHVNGRPVRRMAFLRAGDAIHVEGVELVIRGECQPAQGHPAAVETAAEDSRIALRGVGGHQHGRSFSLDSSLAIGRAANADIVIDDPAFGLTHAVIERHGDRVLLRDLGSTDGSMVNGVEVRHCWLQPGDQVVFDSQHRFVLEDPVRARTEMSVTQDGGGGDGSVEPLLGITVESAPQRSTRWPWLLLSAVLLAAALGSLLLFGAR